MLGRLVAAVVLLVMCMPLFAKDRMDKGLGVSIGMFLLSDSRFEEYMGTGTGINVEKRISSLATGDVYASVGCTMFSQDTQLSDHERFIYDTLLFPVMLTVRTDAQAERSNGRKTYYGLGIGAVVSAVHVDLVNSLVPYRSGSAGATKVDFAWQLVGGMKLGRSVIAEAKYLDGGNEASTGLWLSIGGRF